MNEQLDLWNDQPEPPLEQAPPEPGERPLAVTLSEMTGLEIRLTLTQNRSRMMSYRVVEKGRIHLRLHAMFLDAPEEVRNAVADWIRKPRALGRIPVLDSFVRDQHAAQPAPTLALPVLQHEGTQWNLQEIFDRLNADYFEGAVSAGITWGRMPQNRRRRHIRLGSYTAEQNLIRIHPLLDQSFVPAYFVDFVVFHEMAHAYVGIGQHASGRRNIHSKDFYAQEKRFHQYDAASAWIADGKNLARLLRKKRATGSP